MSPNQEPLEQASIAILIAVYNRSTYLAQALTSACEQSYPNVHVYLCDDHSTDNGVIDEMAKKFMAKYPNLTYLKNRHRSGGPQGPRKTGYEAGKETWIACLDSDNYLEPTAMEECIRRAQTDPEAGVILYGENIVREADIDESVRPWSQGVKLPTCEGKVLTQIVTTRLVVDPNIALCKRSALEEVGGLDDSLKAYECWEQHLRLAQAFPYLSIKKPLVNYRVHGNQITGNPEPFADGLIHLLRKHRHLFKRPEYGTAWNDALFRLWGHIRHARGPAAFRYALQTILLDPLSPPRMMLRFVSKRLPLTHDPENKP